MNDVDLSNVSIKDIYQFLTSKMEIKDTIELLDKAVEGGVMKLKANELAPLLSKLLYQLSQYSETIALAILSMRNHLEDEQ